VTKTELLVIGGTGFIGQHLLKFSISKGWNVTSLSLNKIEKFQQIKGVKYLFGNLADNKMIKEFFSKPYDYVVNLSGYINHSSFFNGGDKVIYQHFDFVRNIARLINREKLKCFMNIGSSDEYGSNRAPQNEMQREAPISPYSFGKTASSHFLEMLNRIDNFPSCSLRLFLVYGPGQNDHRFIPQIIEGCLSDNIFNTSKGEQIRDFCFVEDIVEGIFNALTSKTTLGKTYNLASGIPVSIKFVIQTIVNLIGKGKPNFGSVSYRKGENMKLYADIRKIKVDTGWAPKTSLNSGLDKTVNWYMKKWKSL
jgi:nucleoside-diphosphate-sugar epimerase